MIRRTHLKILSLLTLVLAAVGTMQVSAFSEIPEAAIKAPPMVQEHSVSTFISSDVAPGQGIAINVIYPDKPRYADGAPIAVVIPGADGPSGLDFSAHTAQCGFAEVRFAFPGGGRKGFMSGGIYDYRGAESQRALRDVLSYAAGKTADTQGRKIYDLVATKLTRTNIGIIGWSTGGNAALATMANYTDKLQFISWLAFYESPVGPMFYPPNLGGERDLVINRHYRLGSCATGDCLVDYRKLAWDPALKRHAEERKKRGEPELPGVLYFDDNKNGRWDEPSEFAFSYALDVGLEKQIYPPDVTNALVRLKLFERWMDDPGPKKELNDKKRKINPDLTIKQEQARRKKIEQSYTEWVVKLKENFKPNDSYVVTPDNRVISKRLQWPEKIATLQESEAYYKERDGSLFIEQVCSGYPQLLVSVFGSQIDHMQRQPDHPNIALLYNAFLANRCHWLRLNPDPVYVGKLAYMNFRNFTNNKPNAPVDASGISSALEPEGLVPDYLFIEATAAELADRVRKNDLSVPLELPLVNYNSGAPPPAPPPKPEQ